MYRSAVNAHHPPDYRRRPLTELVLWLLWRAAAPVVALGELVARFDVRIDTWLDPHLDPHAPPALWWVDFVAAALLMWAAALALLR
jgi:hypothetical protein